MFGANCAVDRWLQSLVIRQTGFTIWSKITLWNMQKVWVSSTLLINASQAPVNLGMFAQSSQHRQRICPTSKHQKDTIMLLSIALLRTCYQLTVEKEGFKRPIKVIYPRYVLPGHKHVAHAALPELYAECRETLEEQLKNTYFAITTDLWSSRTCLWQSSYPWNPSPYSTVHTRAGL